MRPESASIDAGKRWLAEWADSDEKPAIYHCVSRVVDRRFVFGDEEREAFRMFMRMYENFTGCRVLSYCVMSNHFHLLLEVPSKPEEGISDELLLRRLGALHSEKYVAGVAAKAWGSPKRRWSRGWERSTGAGDSRAFHLPHGIPEPLHARVTDPFDPLVQPKAQALRNPVGRTLQECDRGERHGCADDGRLH